MRDECKQNGHTYTVARAGYYKTNGRRNEFGATYDQSVEYSTLYCTKCGDTKEIVSSDHRKATT